jgi:O-acetyl-ADP-ribose deacetylase (regulator of RNase III)
LLASCYRRSLTLAAEIGARSVAFPAISTGVYGYPSEDAAAIAVATVRSHDRPADLVRFVSFDDSTHAIYERLLA